MRLIRTKRKEKRRRRRRSADDSVCGEKRTLCTEAEKGRGKDRQLL